MASDAPAARPDALRGMLIGRWLGCGSDPVPTLRRVPLSELCSHLLADTPAVTAEERAAQLCELSATDFAQAVQQAGASALGDMHLTSERSHWPLVRSLDFRLGGVPEDAHPSRIANSTARI